MTRDGPTFLIEGSGYFLPPLGRNGAGFSYLRLLLVVAEYDEAD